MSDCQRLKEEGQSAGGSGTRHGRWHPRIAQPTDTYQTAPSSVLSIAKDGSSPHRMLHNAEGNAPTGCGAAVLCDHSAKSVKSGSCSRLQCTSCNWFGLLQQGGEVGWIIEGSLGEGEAGRGGGGGWRGCIPGAGNPPRHRLRHPPRISAISRFAGRLTDRHRAHAQFQGNEEISSSKEEGRGLPVVPDLVGYLH
jgi:hypothetical protein